MWGCKQHWFKLPAYLRARIWRTYRPGQEISKTPSRGYIAVAQEVQAWIAASAIETRQGGDVQQAPSRSDESAAREAGDAQHNPPMSS
jgi:hypothetical protein